VRRAAALAVLIVAALWSGAAQAQKKSCIRLQIGEGSKVLLNVCPTCRTIKVEHKRPGADAPIFRDYTMGPTSRLPLPFRGPGRTRVIAEGACAKPGGADDAPGATGKEGETCVRLVNARGGKLALVNQCKECRSVVAERVHRGGQRTRQTLVIAGRAAVPLAREGAAQARIVSQRPCRR